MLPEASTATQKDADGQEMLVMLFVPSMLAAAFQVGPQAMAGAATKASPRTMRRGTALIF